MKAKFLTLVFSSLLFISTAYVEDTPPASADAILKEATALAKKEHKKVFIMFHASWCGWCHKMDDSMKDPAIKAFFDRNYVIRHLVVLESKDKKALENPGAAELMKKYNSDGFGIPVWFIFDAKGTILADSHLRPEGTGMETKGTSIIGCPASEPEVKAFIKILKQTSDMNEEELAKVAARFRQNEAVPVKQKQS